MKKFSVLIITSLIIFSCSDPLKIDLQNYTRQLRPLAELEENAINRWNSVSGKNFVNDGYMYQALDSYIIDTYSQFVEKVKTIKTQTNELKELNDKYVKAAEKQLSAFKMMKAGLEKRNGDLMNKSYQLLKEGREDEKLCLIKIEELSRSH